MRRIFLTLPIVILLVVVLASCDPDGTSDSKSGPPPTGTLVSIIVTPNSPTIGVSDGQQFKATGTYSDSSTSDITSSVVWSSSNSGIATINNAGLATSSAAGSTTILATSGSISGNTTLTVISGGTGQLEINSLSTSSALPLSPLTIYGSGFDPLNSAISVVFIPVGPGITTVIPAYAASSDSIKVIVPPFLDQTQGFSSGVMNVRAIQVSGSSSMTSNTIGVLNVGELPLVSPSNPPGAVTEAFVNSGLSVLQYIQTYSGTSPGLSDLLSASNALSSDLNSSIQEISSVVQNPTQTRNLPTDNGKPFIVDVATLRVSDRLIVAYLQQFLNLQTQNPSTASPTTTGPRPLALGCVVDLDPNTSAYICDGRTYYQEQHDAVAPILQDAAAFVYGVPLTLAGTAIPLVAAEFTASATILKGIELAWTATLPYFPFLTAGYEAPSIKEPAAEVSTTLVNELLPGIGPVLSSLRFAADLNAKATAVSPAPVGSAPLWGLILPSPTISSPPGSNAVMAIHGSGPDAITLPLLVPTNQGTISLSNFTLSLATAGTGSGTIASSPSGTTFTSGTVVTLTAIPNSDSTFTGWSGACSGTGQCIVTMNSSKSVTATFGNSTTCSYSLSATSQSFDSSGGSGSAAVVTSSGCSWTAVSNDGWITITSGGSGSDNGTVNYAVTANTGTSQRTGAMTIAGKTFTVTQAGNTSVTPSVSITSISCVKNCITYPWGEECSRDITFNGTASGPVGSHLTVSGYLNSCGDWSEDLISGCRYIVGDPPSTTFTAGGRAYSAGIATVSANIYYLENIRVDQTVTCP